MSLQKNPGTSSNLFKTIHNQEEYWLKILAGELPVLNIPTDHPRASRKEFVGNYTLWQVDQSILDGLQKIADQTDTTLFMILLASYNILLSKYANQEDIIVGTPIINKSDFDSYYFENTLALRSTVGANKTFQEFLLEVKKNVLVAFENQEYPFEVLVEKLSISRGENCNPLFHNMFVFSNMKEKHWQMNELETLLCKWKSKETNANLDLMLEVSKNMDIMEIKFHYCENLFTRETIERLGRHFISILRAVIGQLDVKLIDIELMSEEEKKQLLQDFNNTKSNYPRELSINQLFIKYVKEQPEQIAVVFQNNSLTYRELYNRATIVANNLRRKGIQSDHVVGLAIDRSLEMVVGIMGIVLAGGAFLMIDPESPSERVAFMLEDGGAKMLLTRHHLLPLIPYDIEIIDFDSIEWNQNSGVDVVSINQPTDLAYIMYTSGSTGKPKGVMVEHRNVIRLVKNTNYVQVEVGDRVVQTGAIAFDQIIFEIFGALLNGAELYLIDKNEMLNVKIFGAFLQDNKITKMCLTPALFNYFVQENTEMFVGLQDLIVGGEALSAKHINQLKRTCSDIRIWNGYGPTENTTYSVSYLIEEEHTENIPIGRPISNSTAYILDYNNNLAPIGVAGELCVGGDGVGRGYVNQPDLTKEKFIENPFSLGETLYRTGDMARWLPNGLIEYLGRIDQQVKIRGYRVEIGEVESVIQNHPKIKEAVVVAREGRDNEKTLCGYVVLEEELERVSFREELQKELPDYMVPTYIIPLPSLPLTPNGKVDRKALPDPTRDLEKSQVGNLPETKTEKVLGEIWEEVLGIEQIGVHDNFFSLGGHSLKAMLLTSLVHKKFNVELSVSEIFKNPDLEALAAHIDKSIKSEYRTIKVVEKQDVYMASPAQKRMYTLHQFDPEGVTYNIPTVLMIEGDVSREKIQHVFEALVDRHEVFRTSFELTGEDVVQRIHSKIDFTVDFMELLNAKEEETECVVKDFIKPFDLGKAPLLRTKLIKIEKRKYLLMFDMHHIISDGASMGILTREISELYVGKKLEELKIQYKDYATWQNNLINTDAIKIQKTYWLEQFRDEIPVLSIPTDYPRPTVKNYEGSIVKFKIEKDLAAQLKLVGHENNATLYMILLSIYNVLLSRYSGQEDIVVGSPSAGRMHDEVNGHVGMFVNTLAMRNQPRGEKTFCKFLTEVKENALRAYEHQGYQFDNLVEELNINRDMSRTPLFDTMFVLQNTEQQDIQVEGLKFSAFELKENTAKFDITLTAMEQMGCIELSFNFCTKLFKPSTIQRMTQHFLNIVKQVVDKTDIHLMDINVLSEAEEKTIHDVFNSPVLSSLQQKSVFELFEEQVSRTPKQAAVVTGKKILSYEELNGKANQLARYLKEKGIGPNQTVGIIVERSAEMIVSILATLKAGGAYIPIDSEYPKERVQYLLENASASILLVDEQTRNQYIFNSVETVDVREFLSEQRYSTENLGESYDPDRLMYILYTSGSTGNPKGVMVKSNSFTNLMEWYTTTFNMSEKDNVMLSASVSFDLAQKNIYAPLLVGGKLVLPNPGPIDYKELLGDIQRWSITIMNWTPSAFTPLIGLSEDNQYRELHSLRCIFLGGEPINVKVLEPWINSTNYNGEIINTYGPTECTDIATFYRISNSEIGKIKTVPIGKPIPNVKVYVLDKHQKVLPVGVTGELYIGGVGVSRGYFNDPILTESKFVELSNLEESVFYKTGDLVRWLPDGNIEFLGRVDHQVKIRGVRIELGEIENCLLAQTEVEETIVIDKVDKQGYKYLCAYVVCNTEIPMSVLKERLSSVLPIYMVPTYIIPLPSLPLTPNGKVDRKVLPDPTRDLEKSQVGNLPETKTEKVLGEIWEEVLGIEQIGVHDNFFSLGGDSIRAVHVITQIHKRLKSKLRIPSLFANPTINSLSKMIENNISSEHREIKKAPKMEYYNATPRMAHSWKLMKQLANNKSRNMLLPILVNEVLDIKALNKALNMIVKKHSAFRTSLMEINGELKLKVNSYKEVEFEIIDYVSEKFDLKVITEMIKKITDVEFDFKSYTLLRPWVIRLKDKTLILLMTHHIICDGISMQILKKDLVTAYKYFTGSLMDLNLFKSDSHIQFHDYVHWINQIFSGCSSDEQEQFWIRRLAGKKYYLKLPRDFEQNDESFNVDIFRIPLQGELYDNIKRYSTSRNMTISMLLSSVCNLLLHYWTKNKEITVAMQVNGRRYEEFFNTIGYFVNMIIWNTEITGDVRITDYLKNSNNELLEMFENQDYPSVNVMNKLEINKPLSVFYNFLSFAFDAKEDSFNETPIVLPDEDGTQSIFDLIFEGCSIEGGVELQIIFRPSLYSKETIECLGKNFTDILINVLNFPEKKIGEYKSTWD
ncbi:amino acid adenylation domain-containing protein [Priestia flexa]|uniref:non-ribosomal peptide synthetase n=1 Tax=Priestia flexa TaxID=86664 RepID=UPI002DBF0809|nr:non-ribosomal peptide synthetase [Priestia flexa]MEC0665832.1 amino acid adenylation domain-containing protein [Priestia flexa]